MGTGIINTYYSGIWSKQTHFQAVSSSTWSTNSITELWMWGYNSQGQLGQNNIFQRSSPIQVGGTEWSSTSINSYTSGNGGTFAIKFNGTLWAWSDNTYGSLGLGDVINRSSPTQVGTLTTWSKVFSGQWVTAAIKTDGTLWMWGDNNQGALGVGDVIRRSSPVQVGVDTTWSLIRIGVGLSVTLALKTDGTLWAWGYNSSGQLGIGIAGAAGYRSSPVQIGALTTWSGISIDSLTVIASQTNGTLWSWGYNIYGQLGDGTAISKSSPIQVGALTNWTSKITTGGAATAAIKTDGSLWAWGRNNSWQLGLGNIIYRSSPVQVGLAYDWQTISFQGIQAGLKTDGTLWAWGLNDGQLGFNDLVIRSTPTQVGSDTNWQTVTIIANGQSVYASKLFKTWIPPAPTGTYVMYAWGRNDNYGQLGVNDIISRSNPIQITSSTWNGIYSNSYSQFGIKTDRSLWAWGQNSFGALGLGDGIYRSSPTQVGALTNWSSVGSGQYHTLAIKSDGNLWSWGYNAQGQLGLNDVNIYRSSPVQVGTVETNQWNLLSSGGDFSLGLKTDGTLWSWGINAQGQLGQGNTTTASSPTQIGLGPWYTSSWASVASDGLFTLALRADGSLWSWGRNPYGQLGNNTFTYRSSPVQVGTSTNWSAIAAGTNYSYAVKTDGTLWSWGLNNIGQLGNDNTIYRSSPVQVGTLTDWSNKISIYIGTNIAIKTNGTLWIWGDNTYGQLGQNDIVNRSSPVQVGALTNWSSVAAGSYVNAAIKTDGTLWTWGYNNYGQLGNGDKINRSSPVQVGALTTWLSISAGGYYALAIQTDGSLWSWGYGAYGQLGSSNGLTRSSPVQVGALTNWSSVKINGLFGFQEPNTIALKTDGTMWSWGGNIDGTQGLNDIIRRSSPTQVGTNTDWVYVNTFNIKFSVGIKTNGNLYAWGNNYSSQLGLGTSGAGTYRSSPVQVSDVANWKTISAGYSNSLAIKTNNTLWAWGKNEVGQLGLGDKIYRSSPVQVGTGTNWKSIDTNYQSLAIKTDGTLWAWGYNFYGMLGLGNAGAGTYRSSPVQVGALTNWLSVAANYFQSFAIKTDNTLWAWGFNNTGQLGLGDIIDRSSPTQVGASTDWLYIASGDQTLAIKTNGTLWSWGRNNSGQLGLNDGNSRSSPVQVGALTNWSKVYGGQFASAIKTDGTLWVWGYNTSGQLGDGTVIWKSSPVQVGTNTNWSSISRPYYSNQFSLAVKTDGTAWGWGQNQYGQLGQLNTIYRSSPVQTGPASWWSSVSAGAYQSLATKTDGSLWMWGVNQYGELGLGDKIYRSSPTQLGATVTAANAWVEIVFNSDSAVAIKPNGTLWTWGYNTGGILGLGDVISRSSPVQVGALNNWYKVAILSSAGMAAIKNDGTLWAWGNNASGGIGDGTIVAKSSPIQIGALTNWSKIYGAGSFFAIKTDGTLWSWGTNSQGYLGLGDKINRSSPTQVGTLTNWVSIGAGSGVIVAVKTDGTLWIWGMNNQGQLGIGLTGAANYKSSPVQVGALTNWSSASGGDYNVAAIKTDGTLWTWGFNSNGQLGNSTTYNKSSPIQIGLLTNWLSVGTSYRSVIATKTNGTLWAWGSNGFGSLGDSTIIDKLSPVQIGIDTNWTSVKLIGASSSTNAAAVKLDGSLWVWGRNFSGPLGLGDIINRSSPVQVPGSWARPLYNGDFNWAKAITNYRYTMAVKTDGTLWGWGQNTYGALGLGDVIARSSPVQIGVLSNWSNVALSGRSFVLATKTDGTLWSWGHNQFGALGQGDVIYRSSPVQVGLMTNWSSISVGALYSNAIKKDGTLWSWGYNNYGQLGTGTVISRSSPVQNSSFSNWLSLSAGYSTFFGLAPTPIRNI